MSPAVRVPCNSRAAVARRRECWVRRYLAGKSVVEIAREYGVHPTTIAYALSLPAHKFRRAA